MGKQYKLNIRKLDELVTPDIPLTPVQKRNGPLGGPVVNRPIESPDSETDPGFWSRFFDVLSRPLYATANLAKDSIDTDPNTDNPFESIWAGLSGVDKTTYADVIQKADDIYFTESDIPDWVRGTAGFVGDVVLDPINLIPGAGIAKAAAKGAKKIDRALSGEAKVEDAIRAGTYSARHTSDEITAAGGLTDPISVGPREAEPTLRRADNARIEDPNVESPREDLSSPATMAPSTDDTVEAQRLFDSTNADMPFGENRQGDVFAIGPGGTRINFSVTPEGEAIRNVQGTTARAMERPTLELEASPAARSAPARSEFEVDSTGYTEPILRQADAPDIAPVARGNANPVGTEPRLFQVAPPTVKTWDMSANDIPQAYKVQEITRSLSDEMKDLDPVTRKAMMGDGIRQGLQDAKNADILAGNAPVIRHADQDYYLHVSDIVDSMGKDFDKFHLDVRSKVPTSSLIQGAAAVLKGRSLGLQGDNLFAYVRDAFQSANKTKRPYSASRLPRAVNALIKAGDKLEFHLVKNEQIIRNSDFAAGKALGDSTAEQITRVLSDPRTPTSTALVRVADLYGGLARAGRMGDLSTGEVLGAVRRSEGALRGVLSPVDVAAARDTLAAVKLAQRGSQDAAKGRLLDTTRRDAAESARISEQEARQFGIQMARNVPPGSVASLPPDLFADLADRVGEDFLNGFQRMFRAASRNVVAGKGQGAFFGERRLAKNSAEVLHARFDRDLSRMQKNYGRPLFDQAFNAIKAGRHFAAMTPDVRQVADELYPLMKDIFDPAGGFVDNALFRAGLRLEDINAAMKIRGLPKYQFEGKDVPIQDVLGQMRNWDIADPADFLSKFHAVAVDASVLSTMARHAELLGSKVPKQGFSRVAATDYNKAPLAAYLNRGMYYPDEVIEDMRRANQELLKPTGFGNSDLPIAKFVTKVFDPLLRMWKTFSTIMRPAHHLRNMLGDTLVNYMRGVTNPKHYQISNAALRALGGVDRLPYEELSRVWGEGVRSYKGTKANDFAFTIQLANGQKVHQSIGQFGEGTIRFGGVSDFKVTEDIDDLTRGGLDRVTDKIMNTRYGRAMEKWSEWNSNLQRMAQMSHLLSNPKFTKQFDSVESAYKAAIDDALKAHPDATGLAAWERKWGRRAMPFYSYSRQILPWVIGSILARPGRALSIPKAQYAMLEAMGQDPKSLSEPYTNPEILPPWALEMVAGNITDGVPGGSNLSYSLGSPIDSLAGFLNRSSNPGESFAKEVGNSINPLLKFPFELMDPKNDKSEVIDDIIPGGSTVKSVSGWSPTGSLGNLLTGKPELDETRQVQQGKKEHLFNLSLLNLFTGLGITDLSQYSGYNKPQQQGPR